MSGQDKTLQPRKGKRGPAPTGQGTPVQVRLQPDLLAWVDTERSKIATEPSRPEFIRMIIDNERLKSGRESRQN